MCRCARCWGDACATTSRSVSRWPIRILPQDLELVQRLCADGVKLFKVKTGFLAHTEDLRRLQRLRQHLPDDAEDAGKLQPGHGAVRRDPPAARHRTVPPQGFIEQPVRADKLAALGAITAALDTPVMADESVFSPSDALAVAGQRLADLISIKIMKTGGMLRAREVAAIAAAGGLACYGGSMFETGIGATAGVHFIAATANVSLGCEFYHPTYYHADDLLVDPFPVMDGKVRDPRAGGARHQRR